MFFGTQVLDPASAHLTPLFMRALVTQGGLAGARFQLLSIAIARLDGAPWYYKGSSRPEKPEARCERVAPSFGRQELDWTRIHSTCARSLSMGTVNKTLTFCEAELGGGWRRPLKSLRRIAAAVPSRRPWLISALAFSSVVSCVAVTGHSFFGADLVCGACLLWC